MGAGPEDLLDMEDTALVAHTVGCTVGSHLVSRAPHHPTNIQQSPNTHPAARRIIHTLVPPPHGQV